MADDVVLGIDLGTTNSVVAVADSGQAQVLGDIDGKRLVPSVVSFTPDGIVVGDVARERRLIDAENTVYAMKRLIGRPFESDEVQRAKIRSAFQIVLGENGGARVVAGGETWALAEISAFVLRECRRIAEQVLAQKCERVVITVPANFNELQRSATKAAGKVAGLDVVRILNEPTAAAIAYGCGTTGADRVAVFDLGGGTFDITILELDGDVFEVVATAGDTFLGGDDIDLAIAEYMAEVFLRQSGADARTDRQAFERLRAAAEWVKCRLSIEDDVTAELAEVMRGPDGAPIPLSFRMTRMQLEERILPLVNRAMGVTATAIGNAGLSVADIDTVVLVGGSTRIPLVRQMVRDHFGKEPRIDIDPDLVVALGAAVQGYALSHKRPRKTITVFPTAAAVAEVHRQKQAAVAARPEQPAFAPQNYVPPRPLDNGVRPSGPPTQGYDEPAPLSLNPPLELSSADLEEVHETAARPLSKREIANALFNVSSPPEPADDPQTTPDVDAWAATSLNLPEPPSPAPARPGGRLVDPDAMTLSGAPAAADYPDLDLPEPPDMMAAGAGIAGAALGFGVASSAPPAPQAPTSSSAGGLIGADLFDLEPAADAAPVILGNAGENYMNPVEGQGAIAMPRSVPPILMDVTPHSLGIQTAGGFCEWIVRGNTPIPIEQTRMFTTARDNQATVEIAICQGESRVFEENQGLGSIELQGLPSGPRGSLKIQVTFMLDANGSLDVAATDQSSGQSQRIRVNLVGGHDDEELAHMQERQAHDREPSG